MEILCTLPAVISVYFFPLHHVQVLSGLGSSYHCQISQNYFRRNIS